MKAAAIVPTVSVRWYEETARRAMGTRHAHGGRWAVIVARGAWPAFVIAWSRTERGADDIAAELRGALADAVLAGREEVERLEQG